MKHPVYALSAAACFSAIAGCHSGDAGKGGELLLESRCSVCHSSEIPKKARKSKAEWEKCVSRMMDKGAKLSPEEKKTLINYLARIARP